MGEKQFIDKMVELLDCEEKIEMDTELNNIEEWDSLSFVSFLAMADASYGKKILPEKIREAKKISDLYALVK
ncbi:hypothetical protein [Pectinatus sottacetonis]|uniref:hypothetical protein n=1 Tax=Pectinatus sottacetonis TaxID=1002795 RepID=UPI0018C83AE2|nr:hypothetical protein [Pectinatus sottacetonis]